MQPAEQRANKSKISVVTHQKDGTNGSPEQSTRGPARRTKTEGKATKSLGR